MPTTLSRAVLLCTAALLLATVLASCDQANVVSLHDGSEIAAANKGNGGGNKPPGGGTTVPDSHVSITVGGTTGVTSDGLGDYVGGQDGVRAKIFYHDGSLSRTGGLAFGPQQDGRTRSLTITIGEQTYENVAPYITIAGLMQVGASAVDGWILEGNSSGNAAARGDCGGDLPCPFMGGTATFASTGIPNCGTLRFSGLAVTRTHGEQSNYGSGIKWNRTVTEDLGRWEITGEQAVCEYQTGKGKNVETIEVEVSVPLHLEIEELLP